MASVSPHHVPAQRHAAPLSTHCKRLERSSVNDDVAEAFASASTSLPPPPTSSPLLLQRPNLAVGVVGYVLVVHAVVDAVVHAEEVLVVDTNTTTTKGYSSKPQKKR